ncbi:TetR/AcrR family transcriptional regulator [Caulobacter sp. 17J80-11]|uniref:TetR/AcrR family transcriptional regulator n=1 Tax=Caulobacter sp. 17J80-11 TaxID=2763502 RepID=UPI001653B640|nr:TetR family transcriptional regulator [Caulobacter sp. 17J80-11]
MKPAVPTARTRNSAETRAAILVAARRLFARDSYEQVGLRDIGAAAGVDAALIIRYFGGKEGLFAEVLSSTGDPGELFSGDRDTFGRRIAHAVATDDKGPEGLEGLLIALRSASSPKASGLLRQSVEARFVEPLAAWMGGPEHMTRARLIFAYVMGVAVTKAMMSPGAPPTAEQVEAFTERFAQDLQALLERE